jgi:exodeoxyribonuclease VII small subunit
MASKEPKPGDEGFEALYGRLESSVARLEEGGLTLEESLALYEEGMQLARRCQDILKDAELRITRLQESFSNGLTAIREETAPYPDESEAESERDELPSE